MTSETKCAEAQINEYRSQLAELHATLTLTTLPTARALGRLIVVYDSSVALSAPLTEDVMRAYNRTRRLISMWRSQRDYGDLVTLARECDQIEALEWLLDEVAARAKAYSDSLSVTPVPSTQQQSPEPKLRWWQKLGMT